MNRAQELRAQIPQRLVAIEAFCQEFRSWQKRVGSRDAFPSELLLREALANSIKHGGCPGGSIACVVRSSEKRLLISVRDDGPGFNWRTAQRSVEDAGDRRSHGRGLIIYRQYANRVRFNQTGNGVVLIRFLGREQEETK